ncbi:hypothetical protein M8494_22380 [Serratia ureilytica]
MKANSDELITFVTVVERQLQPGGGAPAAGQPVVSRTVKSWRASWGNPAQPHDTPNQSRPKKAKTTFGRCRKC